MENEASGGTEDGGWSIRGGRKGEKKVFRWKLVMVSSVSLLAAPVVVTCRPALIEVQSKSNYFYSFAPVSLRLMLQLNDRQLAPA